MKIPEIKSLEVSYRDRLVGTISLDANGCCVFEYDAEWLVDGFSISPLKLPLKAGMTVAGYQPFSGNFGIFEDSMPGGYGEYLIQRILHSGGIGYRSLNPLQRLGIVGSAGMGALCYRPEIKIVEEQPAASFDMLQKMALEVLSEKTDEYADKLYVSGGNSGGARPKALFSNEDGHWIIKFRHTYDPKNIGEIEYLYNQAARECGIDVPEFRLVEGKYFAERRYDIEDGQRLHVATAAGLLDETIFPPKMDYHSLLQLTGYLTQSPEQVEQQFRRMCFNVYAENMDDHARNFSFICRNGKWSLSPAYDLTNDRTLGEHATSVNGSGLPTDEDLIAVGCDIRISRARCLEIIHQVRPIATDLLSNIK
mgnify:CR=1 FL=1